jgi:2-polyprenyl-6-methoxyphenol hydroxylase-like FAD-dependent oxidoreductase
MATRPTGSVDVLVVGAGPTGLALAAQLAAFGGTVRVVDRRRVPGRASRALVVQPRTLEVLGPIAVTQALLDRGDQAARVQLHLSDREVTVPLSGFDLDDTSYPFLLVLRQTEVEAALIAHLASRGLSVGWGTELLSYRRDGAGVLVTLRHHGGQAELVRARYLVGCDGANSTVRRHARVLFKGGDYRRSVLLADLDVDADLPSGAAHVFVGPQDVLVLFAAGEHARWRLLVVQAHRPGGAAEPPTVDVQAAVEVLTAGRVRARTVAWTAQIFLQHRLAATFRSGRVFLAGDAAHTHSPAGAQGMNSGIQDAVNLGWKLALASRGTASEALLDSYGAERRPVAHAVLALTHVLFWMEPQTTALSGGLGRRWRRLSSPWRSAMPGCGPLASASWVSSGFATLAAWPPSKDPHGCVEALAPDTASPTPRCLRARFPAACIRPWPRQRSICCCVAPRLPGISNGSHGFNSGSGA